MFQNSVKFRIEHIRSLPQSSANCMKKNYWLKLVLQDHLKLPKFTSATNLTEFLNFSLKFEIQNQICLISKHSAKQLPLWRLYPNKSWFQSRKKMFVDLVKWKFPSGNKNSRKFYSWNLLLWLATCRNGEFKEWRNMLIKSCFFTQGIIFC